MDFEINGLPLHPLLVHATIVILPVAALATILSSISPKIRHRLGIANPIITFIALLLVPLTQAAGTWLYSRIEATPQITRHTEFGTMVLPWAAGLFLVSLTQWLMDRHREVKYYDNATGKEIDVPETFIPEKERLPKPKNPALPALMSILAALVAVGTLLAVYSAGESGTRAVWERILGSS